MFAAANKLARGFTRPIIISHHTVGNKCMSGIGSFVVVNNEGWILTAWHIIDQINQFEAAVQAYGQYTAQRQAIERDTTIKGKEKARRLQAMRIDKAHPTHYSPFWAYPGSKLVDVVGISGVDIAIGRLDPFKPEWIPNYPVFKDPTKNIDPGTSLCRLGFPFHEIEPTFDETTGNFTLPPGSMPPPFFPIEGIFTRTARIATAGTETPAFPLSLIETSSPGLRGQSGGPIFDRDGAVWGIQSRTHHFPLGFSPSVGADGKHKEHQFLNVGLGVHVETIVGFLRERGVSFTLSTN